MPRPAGRRARRRRRAEQWPGHRPSDPHPCRRCGARWHASTSGRSETRRPHGRRSLVPHHRSLRAAPTLEQRPRSRRIDVERVDAPGAQRDIVVVGAGPVGLTAALAVRALGRPVTVVEAGAADRVRPGSRAIFIHGATLDVLERIRPGLGAEFASHGLAWRTKRTLYRGREVYHRTYPPARTDRLPAATSLPQVVQ